MQDLNQRKSGSEGGENFVEVECVVGGRGGVKSYDVPAKGSDFDSLRRP